MMRLGDHRLEHVDMSSQTIEQLKALNGMELLTTESKNIFLKWCNKIQVAKRIVNYNPLIVDYQNELTYRKARDEEYQFQDILEPSIFRRRKIENRKNKAVLSISVSDKQANRAFRIMDALIMSVNEFRGTVAIESGEEDNASFILFDHAFSFQMTEIMVKRRSLLSDSLPENVAVDFRPMYEKISSGTFEIELMEILNYREREKIPKTLIFADSIDKPIEKQLGEIFTALLISANENKIAKFIADHEYEIKVKEQKRLREIEEENRKKLQEIEEENRRKTHLLQNIEQQMENWFKSQKLRNYAVELEVFASTASDEITKELLTAYINFVHQKAENCDPVADILNEVKAIGNRGLSE